MKVRIPVQQMLRLHWLRMKEGASFSKTVEQALDVYFMERGIPVQATTSS